MTPEKKRRLRRVLLAVSLIFFGLLLYAAWPGTITYTISAETTYATEPIDAEGRVDYVAALNTRLRGDITPEQNANVLIWQAIGPHPEGKTLPDEYFQWLGRPAPPEDGEYFVPWEKFLTDKAVAEGEDAPTVEELAEHNARRERALTWPWAATDEPDLAEWLAKNAKPLALLKQASTKPSYYNPLVSRRLATEDARLMLAPLPNVQVYRAMANLLVCRAMLHLKTGHFNEAWQDLLASHRLGRLVEMGSTLIEHLVGVSVQKTAIQGETIFLSQAKLSASQLACCRSDLLNLPLGACVADSLNISDRFTMLDSLQAVALIGPDSLNEEGSRPRPPRASPGLFTRSINWDPAMLLINNWYDRWIAAARLTDYKERERAMGQLVFEIKNMVREVKGGTSNTRYFSAKERGEFAGKAVLGLTFPAVHLMVGAETRNTQRHHNLSIAFALAAYRIDHSKYPPTLAELAPKYLAEIPKDEFTNGELKYRLTATGYLLYSVGPNGTDDEGRGSENTPRGDDVSLEMPAQEPLKKPEKPDEPQE